VNSRGPLSLSGRPWSWITGRPRLTDGVVVVFNLLGGTVGLVGSYIHVNFAWFGVVLLLIETVPLWWRRRFPIAVLAVVAGAEVTRWALQLSNEPSGVGLVFAVYAVSVYGRTRERLFVAGAAIAIIALAITLLLLGEIPVSRALIPVGSTSLVAWVIGDYMRSRRRFFADLVARNQAAREQAAEEERLRIARELHDVVAHNVSVMAIQAGAARVSGRSSAQALQSIETTARDTLSELNRLLGVLRKQPDAPLTPQPGLDQLEALLKTARDAGLDASLKVTGDKRPLPAALDLSAYRIIQEAITNVLKHANATRVELSIDYQPQSLVLAVSDNGAGSTEKVGESAGHGLIGMRERVDLFGGELGAGSSSLGGFTVRARLPIS
jgi:signal transduction histidine kinase